MKVKLIVKLAGETITSKCNLNELPSIGEKYTLLYPHLTDFITLEIEDIHHFLEFNTHFVQIVLKSQHPQNEIKEKKFYNWFIVNGWQKYEPETKNIK